MLPLLFQQSNTILKNSTLRIFQSNLTTRLYSSTISKTFSVQTKTFSSIPEKLQTDDLTIPKPQAKSFVDVKEHKLPGQAEGERGLALYIMDKNELVSITEKELFQNTIPANTVLHSAFITPDQIKDEPDMHTICLHTCSDTMDLDLDSNQKHWDTLSESPKVKVAFGNHSKFPNCKFHLEKVNVWNHDNEEEKDDLKQYYMLQVVNLVDLSPGTDITVNYNSFEWELSSPFRDITSGSMVKGFKYCSEEEQEFLLNYKGGLCFPHIVEKYSKNIQD